jgi:hypothetical protein
MGGGERFGIVPDAWEKAKIEAIRLIVREGRKGNTVAYSEVSRHIIAAQIAPHSPQMDYLLYEISKEEDAAGRGMLTALVVLKDEGIPADGFWACAAELGRDIRDRMACWVKEFNIALESCKRHPLGQ